MATDIAIEQLHQLTASGAQLVDVLPELEFEEFHIPGAISIPLKQLNRQTAAALDRARPVVVYCWDSL